LKLRVDCGEANGGAHREDDSASSQCFSCRGGGSGSGCNSLLIAHSRSLRSNSGGNRSGGLSLDDVRVRIFCFAALCSRGVVIPFP
jgi:hypothetical protein